MRVLDRPGRRVVAGRAAAGAARRFAVAAATAAAVLSTGLVGAVPAQAHGPVTPGTAAVVPPGTYSIENVGFRGQVLTADAQSNTVVGSPAGETATQRWTVAPAGGAYTIKNVQTGRYVGSDGDRTVLQDAPARWNLAPQPGFHYAIRKFGEGRVMELTGGSDGAPVQLRHYAGANAQWVMMLHRVD
ncbi:RICIN domain-containing protein [Actinoallomurus sp. NPDC050550]|uniref:RICIN domain-containing protein n=1 Tax=Actinoallomurus sp. NPDC050550 TaxID=3154937 RepID=UPI0033FAA195